MGNLKSNGKPFRLVISSNEDISSRYDAETNEYKGLINDWLVIDTYRKDYGKSEWFTWRNNLANTIVSNIQLQFPKIFIAHNSDILDECRDETASYNSIKDELITLLNNEELELGYVSESEAFLNKLLAKDPVMVRSMVTELFVNHFEDARIVKGLLHFLCHSEYSDVQPDCVTVALSATRHKNIEVREYGIRAFEKWANAESLRILQQVKCDEQWMQEYVEMIIKDIESEL